MIYEDYAIFTVGPVKMAENILAVGAKQTPYFRNEKFSEVMIRCESLLLKMLNAPMGSRVVFLTASGTAGMEAAVMNLLGLDDNALIVNGGAFGQRFVDICKSYDVPHDEYMAHRSSLLDIDNQIDGEKYTSFLVNAHETSTGNLYDLDAIGHFCKKYKLLNIVDAISMFVTDELDMQKHNIDAVITSSHKGLALPPGLSMVVLNPNAISKINDISSHYFNFKNYLKDGERGQTPYTPAVTIILQLLARLEEIDETGGVENKIRHAKDIAEYFRKNVSELPLDFYSHNMANAMTAITPVNGKSAIEIVQQLENQHKVIVCPNSGEFSDKIFRVSHMGEMTKEYTDILLLALTSIVG